MTNPELVEDVRVERAEVNDGQICGGDAGCESNLFIDNVSIVTP